MAEQRLADVGRKAIDDPTFWRELRANPREALRQAHYTLPEEDIRALEEAVSSNRLVFDLDAFMEAAHDMSPEARWRGRWLASWPGRWPPVERSPLERK
jgi:hypothetical protein